MIGMMVFVLTFAILMFFAAVLHNVIEAAYFCYALDKDAQAITNQDVHNIFQAMPGELSIHKAKSNRFSISQAAQIDINIYLDKHDIV